MSNNLSASQSILVGHFFFFIMESYDHSEEEVSIVIDKEIYGSHFMWCPEEEADPETEFNVMCLEVTAAMDAFITGSGLGEHYESSHLQDVKRIVIAWLTTCYREKGVLLRLNLTSPLFLRQVFTTTHILGHMLDMLTKHAWFSLLPTPPTTLEVRKVHLSCVEIEVRSRSLLEQANANGDVFTNLDEYRKLTIRCVKTPHVPIDVCYISENGTPLSITVLEKPRYNSIQATLNAKKNLGQWVGQLENHNLSVIHEENRQAAAVEKVKRKLEDNPSYEKIKRIRLITEGKHCGECDENGRPFYKLTKTIVSNVTIMDSQTCIVCQESKRVSMFFDTQLKSYKTTGAIPHLKNICDSCLRAAHRYKKRLGK